jgi:hypothetical protein
MRQYLSYGGGVNSTAMMLLIHDEGQEFESIYVDHGGDWPETREYVAMMADRYPITILKPNVQGYDSLPEYLTKYNMIPSRVIRWCTSRFKVKVINEYIKKPCFSLIGISTDEAHRAKLQTEKGIENRFPLLERDIDRNGCLEIIKAHGLPEPIKSGCYFCPFQRVGQWRKLRREHPDLFCKAKGFEQRQNEARAKKGKAPIYLKDRPLDDVVRERQTVMWEEMQPPCQCGL